MLACALARPRDVRGIQPEPGDVSSEHVVLAWPNVESLAYFALGPAHCDGFGKLLVGPTTRTRHSAILSNMRSLTEIAESGWAGHIGVPGDGGGGAADAADVGAGHEVVQEAVALAQLGVRGTGAPPPVADVAPTRRGE